MIRFWLALGYVALAGYGLVALVKPMMMKVELGRVLSVVDADISVKQTPGSRALDINPVVTDLKEVLLSGSYLAAREHLTQLMTNHDWIHNVRASFDWRSRRLNVQVVPKGIWGFIQTKGQLVAVTEEGQLLTVAIDRKQAAKHPVHIFSEKLPSADRLAAVPKQYKKLLQMLQKYYLGISQIVLQHRDEMSLLVSNGIRIDLYHFFSASVLRRLDQVLGFLDRRLRQVSRIQFVSPKRAVVSFEGKIIQ